MTAPMIMRALLNQATGVSVKSSVVASPVWVSVILLVGTMASFHYGLPVWIGGVLFGALILTIVTYITAYIYCLFRDRDSLRSELFVIRKMAIERGFVGDSMTGIFSEPTAPARMLPSGDAIEKEAGK